MPSIPIPTNSSSLVACPPPSTSLPSENSTFSVASPPHDQPLPRTSTPEKVSVQSQRDTSISDASSMSTTDQNIRSNFTDY